MKIEREEDVRFTPFSIRIHFETSNDVSLFMAMLNKIEAEVKPQGLYHCIIQKLRAVLP